MLVVLLHAEHRLQTPGGPDDVHSPVPRVLYTVADGLILASLREVLSAWTSVYCWHCVQLRPLGCCIIPVKTDHHGLIPASLREVLSAWTPGGPDDEHNPVPRVLYTVANGVNPTGASLTLERKQEIYEVCCS